MFRCMETSYAPDRVETRAALLDAVQTITPVLAAHADESERTGTLAEPAWRALHDTGLLRLKAPRVLGGYEADPVTQLEVIEAVSHVDSSAGWTYMVGTGTLSIISAWLPEAGLAELMVDGRLPRTVSAIVSIGPAIATTVPGGYRLTGRWPFGSGSNHAEWFSGKATVDRADGTARGFAFPVSAVRLHDNWQVGALRGTGSQDFSVEDLFVPDRHCFDSMGPAQRGGPLYTIGMPGLVVNEHAGFVLGLARRSIDEMTRLAATKTRGYVNPESTAGRAVFQADLGRADAALLAARAGVIDANERAWANAQGGLPCGPDLQTELRAAAVHCHDVAIEVCQRMFRHAGAKSLFTGNVIERNLRDATAAAQHGQVNETAYELRGREMLGIDVANVRN